MKKKTLSVALILAIAGSMMFSSCIGSFSLTKKVHDWNQNIGGKFVNELVFIAFCIVPVYEVAAFIDALVINSIEFWSGSNPVAQGTKVIDGENGCYLVECDGKGYTIKSETDGSIVRLDFTEEDKSWSVTANGETHTFMSFVDDSHVKMIAPDGQYQVVELSQAGVYAYQSIAATSNFAMN